MAQSSALPRCIAPAALPDELADARAVLANTAYDPIRLLGSGGISRVFEVIHRPVNRRLVVKVLRAELIDDAALVDRLRVEAQTLGALDHPNVVGVTDFGRGTTGQPFFVMERLSGVTLHRELRRRGPVPPERAVHLCRQLLGALGAAHSLGVVHRDIKPANLFLHYPPTGGEVLKVLDFGVAKLIEALSLGRPASPALPIGTGMVVGTPRYASPEQVGGLAVDYRTDLYATALVLYCLLVGHEAFDKLHEPHLLAAQIDWQRHPPSAIAAHAVPPELERAILRGLARDPRSRFQSAHEFDAALGWSVPGARNRSNPPRAYSVPSDRRDPGATSTLVIGRRAEAVPTVHESDVAAGRMVQVTERMGAPAEMNGPDLATETAVPSTRTAVPKARAGAKIHAVQPLERRRVGVHAAVALCAALLTIAAIAASHLLGPIAALVGTLLAVLTATWSGAALSRHIQRRGTPRPMSRRSS